MSLVFIGNFFKFITKKRKAILFALLFFVIVGIFTPQAASAGWGDMWDALTSLPLKIGLILLFVVIAVPVETLLFIFKMLADMSFAIFEYVLNQLIKDTQNTWAITSNNPNGMGPIFLATWDIVKGWANMLIVLGFIAIAVATILRFRDYEAKKLLKYLIPVALLVNFSVVFVGVMIDGSNIVIKSLVVGNEQERSIILAVNQASNNIANPLFTRAFSAAIYARNSDPSTPLGLAFSYAAVGSIFVIMYAAIAIVFFLLALIFIERYIMLAILFILSPLAFIFYVFPFSRDLFKTWWKHFIKWCFAGLAAAFFIRLSIQVIQSPLIINSFNTNHGDNVLAVMPKIIMHIIIVMGFLVAGYKFARKSSAAADMVLKGVKSAKNFAMGAAGVVAGVGLSAIRGATRLGGAALGSA